MQCDACRREAEIFQPYSGKHLCPVHFFKDFEAKAKRVIRSHGWLRPGDHIAVVLPGDAPGAALLVFLANLTGNRRDIRLSAITIDEGAAGGGMERARNMAAACGAGWFCGSFPERYGTTIDAIVQQEGREAAGHSVRVLTSDLIGEIAEAHGVTKCAVATTVDDRAGRFFSDILSGTIEHSLRVPGTLGKTRIPVIRPFMEIPAPEVVRYAELHPACAGGGTLLPCADSGSGATDARAALDAYDARHPATKFALANLEGTLAGIAAAQGPPPSCPVCGEPIAGAECEACGIRRKYNQGALS